MAIDLMYSVAIGALLLICAFIALQIYEQVRPRRSEVGVKFGHSRPDKPFLVDPDLDIRPTAMVAKIETADTKTKKQLVSFTDGRKKIYQENDLVIITKPHHRDDYTWVCRASLLPLLLPQGVAKEIETIRKEKAEAMKSSDEWENKFKTLKSGDERHIETLVSHVERLTKRLMQHEKGDKK